MASATVVVFPMEEGRKLLEALTETMEIKAAFWLYFEEADEWRLVLAVPEVTKVGPRKVYERISEVLTAHPEISGIRLADIAALSPTDPIVRPVIDGLAGKIPPDGTLIRKSLVGGPQTSVYLEEAYVYFAAK